MAPALNESPWRGWRATFGLVWVGILLVFHVYWVWPCRVEIAQRQLELEQKALEVAHARRAAGRLPAARQALAETETRLDELSTALPRGQDAGALLRQLQALAVQTDLSIRSFAPQAAIAGDRHSAWPSRLELAGTFHNLGFFLDRVTRLAQVITVTDIEIRAVEPTRGHTTITATLTATTFVLDEPAADDDEEVDADA